MTMSSTVSPTIAFIGVMLMFTFLDPAAGLECPLSCRPGESADCPPDFRSCARGDHCDDHKLCCNDKTCVNDFFFNETGKTLNYKATPTSTSRPCIDTGMDDVECKDIDGICLVELADVFCPKFCGRCATPTTTSRPCIDTGMDDVECKDIDGICLVELADVFCPKFCGRCGLTLIG